MHLLRAKYFLLLAIFGYFSLPAFAQVNLKIGYNFSILSTPALDRLISEFNQSQAYTSSLPNLQWLQGLETGIRLKGGIHALELTYQGAYKSTKATGQNITTNSSYTDKLKYAIHNAAIGYQLADGPVGFGIDLQSQWYRVKYEAGQTKKVQKNVQHTMGFKFYLMATFHGDRNIDMVLQPYMVLPTKYYDLQPLSEILELEDGVGKDKWFRYGLTVLFYNGAK